MVRLSALDSQFHKDITNAGLIAPIGANGSLLDVIGQITLPVNIGNYQSAQVFIVVKTLTVDCLLGVDYLVAHEVVIDYKHAMVTIKGNEIPFTIANGVATITKYASCNRTISTLQTVTIPSRSIQLIDVTLPDDVKPMDLSSVLIEPLSTAKVPQHVLMGRTFSPVHNGNLAVMQVMNISPTPLTIHQGTKLGEYTPLAELLLVDSAGPGHPPSTGASALTDIDLSTCELSPTQQQQLLALLQDYEDLFATVGGPLGRTSVVRHAIYTEGPPIRQPMRRQPVALRSAIDSEVQTMLQQGVIQPSFSPWSSPVVMVKKKDGSWRFCIDYRKLNGATHRDAYPLPRVDATLDSLAGSTLFTTLDLASGYWQVEVEPQDKEKTAFSTPTGHYEFNVMPFGLTNAPATFQRLMECTLAGLSGEQCLIYLDDIIIFSSTFEQHLQRLASVFDRLRSAGLKLKAKKCSFARTHVTYLGHIISSKGIEPDRNKTAAVATYPTPQNNKEVKQFMGLSNYYRRFIPGYAQIAEPLHRLLKKTSKSFQWTAECEAAFTTLKSKLTQSPLLAYPRFTEPFIVSTDASDKAVGGVLSQIQDGHERVIAYWSRQLKKAERNYSTIEREALAVVGAVKEFYPYLYGFSFKLITDHNPLTSLRGIKDTGGRLTRWLLFLQQFNFTVEYKKGTSHSNADTLSRRPPDSVMITAVETYTFLADRAVLTEAQTADSQLASIKFQLEQGAAIECGSPGLRKCFLKDDLICREYKESATQLTHTQIVIPESLKTIVLKEVHDHSGHLGFKKTFDRVKSCFYWPGYEKDVECWVKQCERCQRRNPPQPNPPAPLGTIEATRPFERLSWDIMGPLPTSSTGNKYILVITDLFTKWVEAFPLRDTTANTLATIMLNEIVCRYGVPSSLHSDQGANLCSSVIQSLCQLLGVSTTRTSAYHPEGNGQVERFNRTLEAILAKTIEDDQHEWDSLLPKALFAYRTAVHDSTHFSPFHLTFGRSPQIPIDLMLGRIQPSKRCSYPQFVDDAHKQLKTSYDIANHHLHAQHLRQKRIHDRNGLGEPFQVGDRVWLYTPVVSKGNTKKFTSFWKGPYTVVDKPGDVSYKIQLIGGTQTFVVHRNRLKPCHTSPVPADVVNPQRTHLLPAIDDEYIYSSHSDGSTEHPPGIAGYTSVNLGHPSTPQTVTRPSRHHRPPARYADYVHS